MDKNSDRYKELSSKKLKLTPFTVEKVFEAPNSSPKPKFAGKLNKTGEKDTNK